MVILNCLDITSNAWFNIAEYVQTKSIICFNKYLEMILEKAMATHSSTLAWKIPRTEEPGRLQSMGSLSRTRLSNFTFTFCFHALEKEMATHSSVLAWRIPGTGEPGRLPSMGSHRVRQDRSDLAVAQRWFYITITVHYVCCLSINRKHALDKLEKYLQGKTWKYFHPLSSFNISLCNFVYTISLENYFLIGLLPT